MCVGMSIKGWDGTACKCVCEGECRCRCGYEGWEQRSGEVNIDLHFDSRAWQLRGGVFCSVLFVVLDVSQIKSFNFSRVVPVLFLAVGLFLLTNT